MPTSVTLSDGTVSRVKLIAVDKLSEEGAALIADYYQRNGVPEEEQYVPAVVIGDNHYMPGAEICDHLMNDLLSGRGLETPFIDGSAR